jgi:hypothetical protein
VSKQTHQVHEYDKDNKAVYIDNVEVLRESGKALMVHINGKDHWIPQSQIHADSDVFSMGTSGGRLIITKWIAVQRELWEE